jgi:antiphage defense system Thoeris ThsB-like protein
MPLSTRPNLTTPKTRTTKDPDYIEAQILAPQIQWASTLVVYITPDTKNSEWVNWEIE